ncbi:MAG: hypothetical protein JXQ27_07790 [Acidobacteria bacterium]|nr:hypothetical protein [Acidobacteriota bacterium]
MPSFPDKHYPPYPTQAPPVLTWFRVYCGLLAFVYVCSAGLGIFLLVIRPAEFQAELFLSTLMGVLYLVMGLVLMAAALVPFFVQPQPWVWIYDLVLIALGMTSCCFLAFSIPLLIHWIKPETRHYFGRA